MLLAACDRKSDSNCYKQHRNLLYCLRSPEVRQVLLQQPTILCRCFGSASSLRWLSWPRATRMTFHRTCPVGKRTFHKSGLYVWVGHLWSHVHLQAQDSCQRNTSQGLILLINYFLKIVAAAKQKWDLGGMEEKCSCKATNGAHPRTSPKTGDRARENVKSGCVFMHWGQMKWHPLDKDRAHQWTADMNSHWNRRSLT